MSSTFPQKKKSPKNYVFEERTSIPEASPGSRTAGAGAKGAQLNLPPAAAGEAGR